MTLSRGLQALSWRQRALIAGAVALGSLAVANQAIGRRAERKHPSKGSFLVVDGVRLHYSDRGTGSPVVLIHGWPLCKESWEPQLAELPKHLRVIAYDRRGFGKSSKPWDGYDSDTLADDLKAVLDQLDLQNVTLVGFSMGGCELARYMSRHNGARVGKLVFVSDVTPYLLKTDDNPSGKDTDIFDNMITRIERDRPA